MQIVTPNEIKEELKKIEKPPLYANQPVPLNDLSDRSFEILIYHIFRERLKAKEPSLLSICDNVSLMQGVGEQGRDILLSKKGVNTGLIQCKKYKKNYSHTEVSQEVLKFVLHYIKERTLIGDIDNFSYFMAVSTGFTGKAISCFNDFGSYLIAEPKLKEWVEAIIKIYPTVFRGWKYKEIQSELKQMLQKIKFQKIIPPDIECWLSEHEAIYKIFFQVLTVTDNTLLEGIIENYLQPILSRLRIKSINNPDYEIRFKEYISTYYNMYSSAKTLVFGNQQKKLEEIYYPLTVIKGKVFPFDSSGYKRYDLFEKEDFEAYKLDEFKEEFIPTYKKAIIIDDGGMGKSTILKWLFLSCIKLNKAIPILIELRNLHKKNDILDEITNQLNPLDKTIEKKATAKILSEKGFVFFFDGYDEITSANRAFATQNLQDFIAKCPEAYFVITSRPEASLLTFSDFQEFNVQRLDKASAFELIKKIDNYQDRSKRLIEQIKQNKFEEIEEFLGNPLLVSLLYKKFEYRESIPFKKQEFYYEVFEALFQAHDLSKGGSYVREKESKLSLTDFFQMLRGIGFRCIKEGIQFNEAQILTIIESVKEEFSKDFDARLFLNDLTKSVPLFQRDGLSIRWAHKSIQQYFAAEYICRDSKENEKKILVALYRSEKIDTYDNILQLCYEIDYKTFRSSILLDFCKRFLKFHATAFPNLKKNATINKVDLNNRIGLLFTERFFLSTIIITETEDGQTEDISPDIYEFVQKKWKLNDAAAFIFLNHSYHDLVVATDERSMFDFSFKRMLFLKKNELIPAVSLKKFRNSQQGNRILLKEDEPFFFDNDDPANILNEPTHFKLLNDLLAEVAIMINYEVAKVIVLSADQERKKHKIKDITDGL